MTAVGESRLWRVGAGLVEARLQALRKLHRIERRLRDFLEVHSAVGAGNDKAPAVEGDVRRCSLEQMRGDSLALLDHLSSREVHGVATRDCRTRAEGADAERRDV